MATATNLNAYEDSSEFEADMSALQSCMHDVELILNKPEFEEYMIATGKNFGGDAVHRLWALRKLAGELETDIKAMHNELIRVTV
jgi:hypothetical protein